MSQNIFINQNNYSGGVITDKASARTDLPFYHNSFKDSRNLIVTSFGSLISRPGFSKINATFSDGPNTPTFLSTFKYSDTDSVCLGWGNKGVRFFKDKSAVDHTINLAVTGAGDWADSSVGTGVATEVTGHLELTGAGVGNDAISTRAVYFVGLGGYQLTFSNDADIEVLIGTTPGASDISYQSLSAGDQLYTIYGEQGGNTLTTLYITFKKTTGAVSIYPNTLYSSAYILRSPFTNASSIHTAQFEDVMYIVGNGLRPYKLTRYSDSNWTLLPVDFKDGPYLDENNTFTTVTPSDVTGSITLTFSSLEGINNNQGFSSDDIGRLIRIRSGPDDADSITYAASTTRTTFPITFSFGGTDDVECYAVEDSTGIWNLLTNPTDYTINTLGQVVTGSALGINYSVVVQRSNTGTGRWGYATITAITDPVTITATVTEPWHGINATLRWRLGAFSAGNYPVSCCFHEQRLYLAGRGSWVWASQIGDFENFQIDDSQRKGAPNDATSIAWKISSTEANDITNIVSQQGLAVFSTGDLSSLVTQLGQSLSPLNQPTITKNAELSCSHIRPCVKDRLIFYSNNLGNSLGAISFDYNSYGYVPMKLDTFAENLFTDHNSILDLDTTISQIVYQTLPKRIIWILRSDGKFISYTLDPENKVSAFALHEVGGLSSNNFEPRINTFTVVPSGDKNDHLYAIIEQVEGVPSIQVMDDFYDEDRFLKVGGSAIDSKARFLDGAIHYYTPGTAILTGLDHLEGSDVQILTEEGVHPIRTVNSGQVTLNSDSYNKIDIGAYSYRKLQQNPIQMMLQVGDARNSPKSIYSIGVQCYRTAGLHIGTNLNNLTECIFTVPTTLGTNELQLFSGIKEVNKTVAYSATIAPYIVSKYPLPLTIQSVITKLAIVSN